MGYRRHGSDQIDKEIVKFFKQYQALHGRPPTVREVMAAVQGLNSPSSVKYRLDRLVEKGVLQRFTGPGRSSRTYYLPETNDIPEPATGTGVAIPVLGYITASGQDTVVFVNDMPVPSMETIVQELDLTQVEDVLHLDELLGWPGGILPPQRYFALRVQGTSMQDRGILPGDVVIFRRIQEPPPRRTLVAVRVDDWLTLKEFRGIEGPHVVLQPANQAEGLQPIYVPADQVHFEGQAVWVVRAL